MEKFSLQHTVLYAKGWYKKYSPKGQRKTIWDDLKVLIEADGYLGFNEGDTLEQTKNRIAYLLISQIQRIPLTGNQRSLSDFFEAIKPNNCWKYWNYDTKQNCWSDRPKEELPDWDINEAAVKWCLSEFGNLKKEQWNSVTPSKEVLPLSNGISNKKIKEIFGSL